MFSKAARYLATHTFPRHLFFLGIALIAVAYNGYHFGTFDQVFHITYLKKFIDPALYPNDPFLDLRWYHFSFFWFPFIPLVKAGFLELGLFFVHIITIYGTIWMFYELANLLFHDQQTNLLLVLALIFPHLGFPGFQIVEFSLLNRTFILPFLLASIYLYLKDRRLWAYIILGLMFNLHVIYALFVLCMFLLHDVLTFKWRRWWSLPLYLAVFIVAGLPVLIWRMQTGDGIDLSLRPEMLDLAARALLFTVYFPFSTTPHVVGNLLAGIGTVWAFCLGFRSAPSTKQHQTMLHFAYAIGILILISVIAAYWLPVTILLQMQLMRAGLFMLYFSMLYFAFFVTNQLRSSRLSQTSYRILALAFILLITPLAVILIWYFLRYLESKRVSIRWAGGLVAGIWMVSLVISITSGLWQSGLHIFGPRDAWRDVQDWARDHTPTDTLFITPPHIFWHYTPDWRVFSERSAVATVPEMMEIPFNPAFEFNLRERFEAVAPGAMAKFNGNYVDTLTITRQAFYQNQTADFVAIGCRYGADFLVSEKPYAFSLPIVYENDRYRVFILPGCP